MIDLHTHVLPGLDDGAQSIEDSLALARAAHDAGTSLLVATPHVREDYPFDLGRIGEGVENMVDHAAAGERMQDLGDARTHARPLAGCENDGRGSGQV